MTVSGELKQWHKTTVAFEGPSLSEDASTFTDYRLDVTFTHVETGRTLTVPGYFAADGNAAETGATFGNVWHAHLSAPLTGEWTYEASFVTGTNIAAFRDEAGTPTAFDGETGAFTIAASDKTGLDARAPDRGTLVDGGDGYLEFAGSGDAWIKTGVDSPENFLAYEEFDNTIFFRNGEDEIRYEEHRDAFDPANDPSWGTDENGPLGDEIIGASNYLASQGMNSIYLMPFTIGGDGRDTSPFVDPALYDIGRGSSQKTMTDVVNGTAGVDFEDFVTYDVSKLAQWDIFFGQMQKNGQNINFVFQEQENDQMLDETGLGYVDGNELLSVERAIYLREMVARFGHNPMMTWMLGEENTARGVGKAAQVPLLFDEVAALDAYDHMAAIHTFPGSSQDAIYNPLLGDPDTTGASLQTSRMNQTYQNVQKWVTNSENAGQRWVVMADETSDARVGAASDSRNPGHNEARSEALWGSLMAGAGGIEWYMGGNDQNLSDMATREGLYEQSVIARELFETFLPFREMETRDELRDLRDGREGYVFAKANEVYLVYTEDGDRTVQIDLSEASGEFVVYWLDPFEGGKFELGDVETVSGGGVVTLGSAPATVIDNRLVDTALQGNREAIVEDAVLLIHRVDIDLGITPDDVVEGRLAGTDPGDPGDPGDPPGLGETVGGSGDDTLAGTAGDDVFTLNGGSNLVTYLGGADVITDFDVDGGNENTFDTLTFSFAGTDYTLSSAAGFEAVLTGVVAAGGTVSVADGDLTIGLDGNGQIRLEAVADDVPFLNDPAAAPVADDATVTLEEDGSATIDPADGLAADPNFGTLTYEIVGGPQSGTADLIDGRIIAYTPAADFFGADSVVYRVTDPDGLTADGTITFDVTPVNDAPVVSPVAITVAEDSQELDPGTTIGASAFGFDPDGQNAPQIYVLGQPTAANGTVNVFGEGTQLSYVPDPDFFGEEVIEITFFDQSDTTSTATTTLTVTVTPVNDAPTAGDGFFDASVGETITIDLATEGLVGDVDGDPLAITIGEDPTNGVASLDGTVLTYTPTSAGVDLFTFTATDPDGEDAIGSITVEIDEEPATGPVLVRAINVGSDTAYTALDGTVFEADTVSNQQTFTSNGPIANTEDDPLYVTEAWAAGGDLTLDFQVENGDYLVRAHFAEIWNGITPTNQRIFDVVIEDELVVDDLNLFEQVGPRTAFIAEATVTVEDGELNYVGAKGVQNPKLSAIEIFSLSAIDLPPEVEDLSRTVEEDGTLTVAASAFGFDPEGRGVSIAAASAPANGSVAIAQDGSALTYTPDAAFAGTEAITVTIADGSDPANTATATLDIVVEEVNDPPIAVDDTLTFSGQQVFLDPDTGLASIGFSSFDFLDNDIEDGIADGEFVTPNWLPEDLPDFGEFIIAGEGTVIEYIFDPANFPGSDTFSYRRLDVTDNQTLSNEATVTIEIAGVPTPPAPFATTFLADANSNELLFELSGFTFIDADSVAGLDLTAAAFSDAAVGSARLQLFDDFFFGRQLISTQTENIEPYTLFGDTPASGNLNNDNFNLADGDRAAIEIDFFSGSNGSGTLLAETDFNIEIDNGTFSDSFNTAPDTFAFDETKMGADTIVNFSELDTLALFGGSLGSASEVIAAATVSDGDTTIDFGGGNVLTLRGFEGLSEDDVALMA